MKTGTYKKPFSLGSMKDLVIKINREISLPKLRCKQGHMPKSIVWIIFNSKCEGESKRERDK